MELEDYAKRYLVEALGRTDPLIASDVYVVSLFVYDEEDDPRLPTVTVGFNTEARVAETAEKAFDEEEARWNYAFWLQNELGVLGDRNGDPDGARLRDEWVVEAGLWFTDEDADADIDAAEEKIEQITSRFVERIVTVTQRIHAEGTITRIFGRAIPVLIHELEYYDEIAQQNLRANPNGLADDFARWIAEM
jgi:hypothetical protein